MTKERAVFMPVTDDLDEQLETLARKKGVGELVKPAAESAGDGEGARAPHKATGQPPRPHPTEPMPAPVSTGSLTLPNYVWTDLKMRAAHGGTVRHIIMTALKAHGVTIADIDMVEDGRRLRGSKAGSHAG